VDNKIISLANKTDNGMMQTPENALLDALETVRSGEWKGSGKILILSLGEGDNNDEYNVGFIQAGLKMSQCVTLCEASKMRFLSYMGYIPDE